MKFDDRMGIMYDTLFYGVIYFNQAKVKELFENTYSSTEDFFQYFDKVKKDIPELPSLLYPFFFTDCSQMSFLVQYMYNNFDLFNLSYAGYINKLASDPSLKQTFFHYYVSDESLVDQCFINQNFIPLIPAITDTNYTERLKLEILNLLAKFDMAMPLLIELLEQIHSSIEELHKNMYTYSQSIISEYATPGFQMILKNYCDIPKTISLKNQIWSISYLHIFLLYYRFIDSKCAFVYGYIPNALEVLITKIVNYKFLKVEDIFYALAHPIKREIIEKLMVRDYTATQLSEVINASRQSINLQLLWLHDSKFITISKKIKTEKYYTLNYEYLNKAHSLIDEYLIKICKSDKEKKL